MNKEPIVLIERSMGRVHEVIIRPKERVVIQSWTDPEDVSRIEFKLGDFAIYDSYNFDYTGKIVSIGPKTVTFQPYPDHEDLPPKRRLRWSEFAWRNWDYDPQAVQDRYVHWSYTH